MNDLIRLTAFVLASALIHSGLVLLRIDPVKPGAITLEVLSTGNGLDGHSELAVSQGQGESVTDEPSSLSSLSNEALGVDDQVAVMNSVAERETEEEGVRSQVQRRERTETRVSGVWQKPMEVTEVEEPVTQVVTASDSRQVSGPRPFEAEMVSTGKTTAGAGSQAVGKDGASDSGQPQESGMASRKGVSSSVLAGSGLEGYLGRIRAIIEANKLYPSSAARKGRQGRVVVAFSIGADGSIFDVELERRSRYRELNRAAKATVLRSSPLPPPPAGMDAPVLLDVTLEFRLE